MDCYCDYDELRFCCKTQRKARQVHPCDECGARIQPSETYEHVAAYQDGMNVYKTCVRCVALRDYVKAHVPCFCWMHFSMIDNALETCGEYAHEAPGLLFGAYRRQIAIKRAAGASRAN